MSKPFTLTLCDDITPRALAAIRKPGWHKRAQVAAHRASYTARTTAPQHGTRAADDKAAQYAVWLAKRDGLMLSADDVHRVTWEACAAGMRPRFVLFAPRGATPVRIELPHWSYVAPDVVETHASDWHAPVASEVTGEARDALLVAYEAEEVALWVEAMAPLYGQPGAYAVGETWDGAEQGGDQTVLGMPITEQIQQVEAVIITPAMANATLTPDVEIVSDSDDWAPDATSHPIVAHCLSEKARDLLFARLQDGTFPAECEQRKAGAFRLTLADALACQDVKSIRFAGMPRKAYTRIRIPVVGIDTTPAPVTPVAGIQTHAPFITGGPDRGATLHAPMTL